VATTAVALLVIAAYVLGYHEKSARRERNRRQRQDQWTERWVGVLFGEGSPPEGPLPAEGVESLLDLREQLIGSEGAHVESLVGRYGIVAPIVDRSRALRPPRGPARWLGGFGRRRLSSRLEALEALAKARPAEAVGALLELLEDREPPVRVMTIRSLARTLARLPEGPDMDRAADRFAEAVPRTELPSGVVEEALLLLEGAAPRVLRRLLGARGPDRLVPWALDAVGRLKLLELRRETAAFADHPNPEVRSAAVRALGRLGILPRGSGRAVRAALTDPVEFVRVQACRTAALLPRRTARPALWKLLGDESWWVRRAAAHTLLRLGADGPEVLERAGRKHPDRYARHMAVQVLLDDGRIDALRARRLREAV
jgi:hypothetical protein